LNQVPILFTVLVLSGFLSLVTATCTAPQESGLSEETTAPDASEPELSINYIYYEITGATATDLRRQMDQSGSIDRFGHRHDMYTDWQANWSYPYVAGNHSCAVGPVQVTVAITFTFPNWDKPAQASSTLVAEWNEYLNKAQAHEDGHKEIAVEAGHKILYALKAMPVYPSCAALEQAVDQTGQDILEQFRQKELVYDQETNHGATQGARFP
jgi:predicted secreted Zn-dependent protease